jgi:Icc-related predicted phosphoesterase
MAKVAVFSDLHTEHSNIKIDAKDADILVFDGDILAGPQTEAENAIEWIYSQVRDSRPCIFVAGNHEFEKMVIDDAISIMRKATEGTQIHLLHNETFDFEDIRFIGTPLFSGFNLFNNIDKEKKKWLFDELKVMDPLCEMEYLRESVMRVLEGLIQDFQRIRIEKDSKMTPWDMSELYFEATRFIKDALIQSREDEKKSFVITHYAPSPKSLKSSFQDDFKAPYWVNDCEHLVKMANIWVHGHTHRSFNYRVGDNKNLGNVFCNPRGVTKFIGLADNQDFQNPLIIDTKKYKCQKVNDVKIPMKKVKTLLNKP